MLGVGARDYVLAARAAGSTDLRIMLHHVLPNIAEPLVVTFAELRDQVRELAQLNPSAEEWESLQQEHSRLAHAASLLAGGEECRELLAENDLEERSLASYAITEGTLFIRTEKHLWKIASK